MVFRSRSIRAGLVQLLADPRLGRAWVAEHKGHRVGYAMLTYNFDLEFGGLQAILTNLFVVDPTPGKWSGNVAARRGGAPCRRRRIASYELQVASSNLRAQRFYARAGFDASLGGDGQVTRRLTRGEHADPADAARWATPATPRPLSGWALTLARTWAAPRTDRGLFSTQLPDWLRSARSRSTTTPRSSTNRTTGAPRTSLGPRTSPSAWATAIGDLDSGSAAVLRSSGRSHSATARKPTPCGSNSLHRLELGNLQAQAPQLAARQAMTVSAGALRR